MHAAFMTVYLLKDYKEYLDLKNLFGTQQDHLKLTSDGRKGILQ